VDDPVAMFFEIGTEVVSLFALHIPEQSDGFIHLTFL
jgi:hypothetical protein